jgi:dihydrofolate reductase
MKLTTVTNVSVDGVMQGLGGPDEDRRGGFERGGWALPLFENDNEAATFLNEVYQRADAFLFGRQTYEIFAGAAVRESRHPEATSMELNRDS